MSTVKSDNSDITIDASGSGRNIKFQANGVEKASISSSGAFTSTTIDATKLTGTIPNFTSTGIDDNADATAITIDSSEQVGIGVAPSDHTLSIKSVDNSANVLELASGDSQTKLNFSRSGAPTAYIRMYEDGSAGTGALHLGTGTSHNPADILKITSDGRGLSQFTAKAWVNFNGQNTPSIRSSHNCSSITDVGTGDYKVNFTNAMANVNYAGAGLASDDGNTVAFRNNTASLTVNDARVSHKNNSNTYTDGAVITFIFFGD